MKPIPQSEYDYSFAPLDRFLFDPAHKTLTTTFSNLWYTSITGEEQNYWRVNRVRTMLASGSPIFNRFPIWSHVTGKVYTFELKTGGIRSYNGVTYWFLYPENPNCPVSRVYVLDDSFCGDGERYNLTMPMNQIIAQKLSLDHFKVRHPDTP